jgi:hypothetical protein
VLSLIASEDRVWFRIGAVLREDGLWHVRLAELTGGAAPPSWEARQWYYPETVFAGGVEVGRTVAGWFRASTAAVANRAMVLPPVFGQVTCERQQSFAPTGFEPLAWPMAEAVLAQVDSRGEPPGHLVSGEGAPSFVRFFNAAASFFGLGEVRGGQLPQRISYRHQDQAGRITSIKVADQSLCVTVEGPEIGGMELELAGDAPGIIKHLAENGDQIHVVTFVLESGLPSGAWVLLKRESEWMDRRFLTRSWSTDAEAGVEFVNGQTRLQALVSEREGPTVEFKLDVPVSKDAASVMKTVCAFANGQGGSILFGVDDELGIPGLPNAKIGPLENQLTQLVDAWVQPRPAVTFESLPTDLPGKSVLEMRVANGSQLYGARTNLAMNDYTPYIRHYAITVRARVHEIEQIVKSRPGSDLNGRYGVWPPRF